MADQRDSRGSGNVRAGICGAGCQIEGGRRRPPRCGLTGCECKVFGRADDTREHSFRAGASHQNADPVGDAGRLSLAVQKLPVIG